ncbi:MAG: DUF4143 domain-containing protein [Verrucomicrobiota bacterium]
MATSCFPEYEYVSLEETENRNFSKRTIKSPKLYFHDTGLAAHLLGIRTDEQLYTHTSRGALFENLIVAEAVKAYTHHRREPPIYFWRDQTGHELDLLIEDADLLYPVEIKSGATVGASMFDNLKWWNRLAGNPAGNATLIYGGDHCFAQNEINVRPWYSIG